mgnify:CR=1 FL=1
MNKKQLEKMLKAIENRNIIEDGRIVSKLSSVFDIDSFDYQEKYNNFAFHISRKVETRKGDKVIALTKYYDMSEMMAFTKAKTLQEMLETINSYKYLHLEQTFDGENYDDISVEFE